MCWIGNDENTKDQRNNRKDQRGCFIIEPFVLGEPDGENWKEDHPEDEAKPLEIIPEDFFSQGDSGQFHDIAKCDGTLAEH